MRKRIVLWMIAFVGFCNLAGCAWFDSWRDSNAGESRWATGIASPVYKNPVIRPPVAPPPAPSRTPAFLPPAAKNTTPEPNQVASQPPETPAAKMPKAPEQANTEQPIPVPEKPEPSTPAQTSIAKTATPPANVIEQAKIITDLGTPEPVKSASIKQGKTDAYATIVGQVQQFRKTWRLRYASVEKDDPHGGSVALEGDADFNTLREGMTIRVHGVLVPATDRSIGARYRVQSFEVVE